jgi:excisionase family DNA binding protein
MLWPEEPVVLTVKQAARLLQVSKNHVYSLIDQNLVPHLRLGKLIRIPKWGLLRYIARTSGAPLPDDLDVALLPDKSVHGHDDDEEEA